MVGVVLVDDSLQHAKSSPSRDVPRYSRDDGYKVKVFVLYHNDLSTNTRLPPIKLLDFPAVSMAAHCCWTSCPGEPLTLRPVVRGLTCSHCVIDRHAYMTRHMTAHQHPRA